MAHVLILWLSCWGLWWGIVVTRSRSVGIPVMIFGVTLLEEHGRSTTSLSSSIARGALNTLHPPTYCNDRLEQL